MLTVSDLPRKQGIITGAYRLRMEGCNEVFSGADFRDGVTVSPVGGNTVNRLCSAFGSNITIEPYDDQTLAAILAWVRAKGERGERHAAAIEREYGGMAPPPKPEPTDLDAMTRDQLFEVAVDLGLEPVWNTGPERLKELIEGARRRQNQDQPRTAPEED